MLANILCNKWIFNVEEGGFGCVYEGMLFGGHDETTEKRSVVGQQAIPSRDGNQQQFTLEKSCLYGGCYCIPRHQRLLVY